MPNQISEETIEEIRNSNDIVDIIGEYVQLKKQGRNYFGLCPFHGEKTPSFSVTQEKQIFHCFGCGKGGNVITFIMELEGFTFYQAIQHLAEKSGYELPKELQEMSDKQYSNNSANQEVLKAYEWLTKLYHHLLLHSKEGKEGYQYLLKRGFSDEMINTFQIGFSPNSRDFIVKFLEKKGFHKQAMVKAGILTVNDQNQVVDRFRGRVMFPIRNHLGKTIGFGGRTISDQEPKYLNSPETDLFQKGKLLYNFDLARGSIRSKSEAVLFEGYMDVISAYKADVHNGVATLGTSITETQAKLLRRYVDNVIICYDSDKAGLKASHRAAKLLQAVGCNVRIATMNEGLDPDDFINTYGADRFKKEIIELSDTYMAFMMKYLQKDYNLKLEGDRIQYVERVLDEISKLDRLIEREHYLKELATNFDLSFDTLVHEIDSRRKKIGLKQDSQSINRHTKIRNNHRSTTKLLPAFHKAERKLIAYMLNDENIAEKVKDELGGAFNIDDHKVIVTYLYAYYEDGHEPNISHFIEKIPDSTIKDLIIQIGMEQVQSDISDQEINDYIRIISAEHGDKALIKSLRLEQKEAEKQSDPVKAAQIGMQILEIQRQMKNSNH